MKFAEWAPKELVESYLNSVQSLEPQDQTKQKIIFRLLTRPEMQKVWQWVNSQAIPLSLNSRGGLIGTFFRALDRFDEAVKVPNSERERDFQEIHKLALNLSIKLSKYQHESHAFSAYTALIDSRYDDRFASLLHPTIQEKAENRYFLRNFWAQVLPPIHEVVKAIANAADVSDAKLNRHFPKKIRQENSLVTFLVHVFCEYNFFQEKCPHTIAATFLSVALDDSGITPDLIRSVRKDERF